MSTRKNVDALKYLHKLNGGPVRLHQLIEAIRLGEELSQPKFAKILKVSTSHLNDIEKGRRNVSPERAIRFAKALGRSPERFLQLALQALVDETGLKLKVNVEVA